jgi:thymidylate synthase ThyX
MNASLVYDGGQLHIPASMGTPCDDQLVGTPLENLGELASRICYESLGLDEHGKRRGRSAAKLHEHILEVNNTSVYEHCDFTVRITHALDSDGVFKIAAACANRKGVWVEYHRDNGTVDVTANFRSVIEWARHTGIINAMSGLSSPLGASLYLKMTELAPAIAVHVIPPCNLLHALDCELVPVEELTDDQAWISLWLYGSRGFSHEQVRHRFAMSQRSTRYVDEDGSPYITHPLVAQFLADPSVNTTPERELIATSIGADRATYRWLVEGLQKYCIDRGLDAKTARKQARGAARGYLGNALATEMIYSAPVSGWKWILSQRKNKNADAEIRQIFSPGLEALKSSQYGDRFSGFNLVPSPDGLGTVLADRAEEG